MVTSKNSGKLGLKDSKIDNLDVTFAEDKMVLLKFTGCVNKF